MKHLKHRQDALDHKIEALEDDMISITKETFEELDYLRRELELTGYNIKVLTAEIKRVEYELSKHVERVMDNSNSILFLSGTISVLLSEMERYLALHERVKSELDHILDALDNLSNNLLSHSVIRPSVLKRLIEHVRQQLAEKYSNYELVITEVHDYYNIPVSANSLSSLVVCWFSCSFMSEACAGLGNRCERFCTLRPLLGSYFHQKSI